MIGRLLDRAATSRLALPDEAASVPLHLDNGAVVQVKIRRSKRATRIALRLRAADPPLELVLPQSVALAKGLRFLEQRRDWVTGRLDRLPAAIPFEPGIAIPILGRNRLITALGRGTGKAPPFRLTDDRIEVTGDPSFTGRRVRQGIAALARQTLTQKSQTMAGQLGKQVGQVSVGDARTRWGSCSSSHHLRYSWRLILAPERVMDYVVAHEVAHLVHMNHGELFWNVVANLHPNCDEDRSWLRAHGPSLLRYGR